MEVRIVSNARAAPRSARALAVISVQDFASARAEIVSWPGYQPTPLVKLAGLGSALGVGSVLYKDEAFRFGLGSFKALGGAYAVARVLSRELGRCGLAENATAADFLARRYADSVSAISVTSATDGNHGRSVAWGAQMFGCRAVIYIHETVSEERGAAIGRFGAEVVRTSGGYDDAVRHAFAEAQRRGWHVVQDTAISSYRAVTLDITCGYGVIATEVMEQASERPTHVIVQAGVGGLASAICARFWQAWGRQRPRFLVLEPSNAACVAASLEAGKRVDVTGDLETVMAGLACGEVSELAWDVLATGADSALVIDDSLALEGMRRLAFPRDADPVIVGGECSGGAVGALLGVSRQPQLMTRLGLNAESRVLLIGTEGATDPAIYEKIVGTTSAQIVGDRKVPATK